MLCCSFPPHTQGQWDLPPHACPSCSLLLAGRGLMMPRELQETSSLPSQEQWGLCGRLGKCGQIPGLAVTQLGTLFLPGSLSASSGRRRAGGCQPCRPWKNTGQPSHRTPRQRAPWPHQATSLLPICLGTKRSHTATELPDDTTMQQTRL